MELNERDLEDKEKVWCNDHQTRDANSSIDRVGGGGGGDDYVADYVVVAAHF